MKRTLLTLVISVFLLGYCQAQSSGSVVNVVTIDKQIQDSIEARTIELDGRLFGSINFRLFGNDSLVLEHQAFDINSYAKNMSFLNDDTIRTVGYLNFIKMGFGYSV